MVHDRHRVTGIALAQKYDGRIQVDFLMDTVPGRLRQVVDVVVVLAVAVVGALFAWYGWQEALEQMEVGELRPHRAPADLAVPLPGPARLRRLHDRLRPDRRRPGPRRADRGLGRRPRARARAPRAHPRPRDRPEEHVMTLVAEPTTDATEEPRRPRRGSRRLATIFVLTSPLVIAYCVFVLFSGATPMNIAGAA